MEGEGQKRTDVLSVRWLSPPSGDTMFGYLRVEFREGTEWRSPFGTQQHRDGTQSPETG